MSDEHAVAVACESKTTLNGMRVGGECLLTTTKSAHQHEERRAWEVEIREERVDHPELEPRRNEESGADAPCCGCCRGRLCGGESFEGADDGGADCDDATAFRARSGESLRCRFWKFRVFCVEDVVLDALVAQREEGTRAYFEIHEQQLMSAAAKLGQRCFGEVQPGSGCRDRARALGKNGLVACAVLFLLLFSP